jgi:hypothetical protein
MSNRGGKREGAGRRKGSQNRFTSAIKDAVLETFEKLGGVTHMTTWARKNPTDFYRIAAKLIPQQINADVSHFDKEASEYSDAELEHIIATGSAPGSGGGAAKATKGQKQVH